MANMDNITIRKRPVKDADYFCNLLEKDTDDESVTMKFATDIIPFIQQVATGHLPFAEPKSLEIEFTARGAFGICILWDGYVWKIVAPGTLKTESAAITQAIHPNIVRVVKFGTLPCGMDYLQMPYRRLGSLHSWLRRRAKQGSTAIPIHGTTVVRMLGGLTCGVARAHRNLIYHGDLKPQNILVVEVEKGMIDLEVCDFGQARRGFTDPTCRNMTVGELGGTSGYMACKYHCIDIRRSHITCFLFAIDSRTNDGVLPPHLRWDENNPCSVRKVL